MEQHISKLFMEKKKKTREGKTSLHWKNEAGEKNLSLYWFVEHEQTDRAIIMQMSFFIILPCVCLKKRVGSFLKHQIILC